MNARQFRPAATAMAPMLSVRLAIQMMSDDTVMGSPPRRLELRVRALLRRILADASGRCDVIPNSRAEKQLRRRAGG